jgi:hypothetical protein
MTLSNKEAFLKTAFTIPEILIAAFWLRSSSRPMLELKRRLLAIHLGE